MDMRLSKACVVVILFACALACRPVSAADQPHPGTQAASETIDHTIQAWMEDGGLVGVGAAIIIDKQLVWSKGYGFADKQRAVRFTPNTVMNVASISKTFIGVALMQAVQDGKLSLDADINALKAVRRHLGSALETRGDVEEYREAG